MRVLLSLLVALVAAAALAQAPGSPAGSGQAPAVEAAASAAPLDLQLEPPPGGYTYEPRGRRDPFVSLQKPVEDAERGGRRLGMEGFLIQEVALRGIVKTPDGYIAMLQGPDNKSYFVRVGQRLYDGQITTMDMATVTFRQDVTDPLAAVRTREVKKSLYPLEEARQ